MFTYHLDIKEQNWFDDYQAVADSKQRITPTTVNPTFTSFEGIVQVSLYPNISC